MIAMCMMCALASGPPQADDSYSAPLPVVAGGPVLVLPRQSFSWKADGFGQVVGDTIACAPLPGRVKSIVPGMQLPAPLSAREGAGSLRIAGTTAKGLTRDIAALQWTGPVITWQRLSVPAAAFEQSLKALSAWMMTNSFAVTLEDGRVIQVGAESQRLSVELGTAEGSAVSVAIADVPKGMRIVVPGASPMPADGAMGAGPFLLELDRSVTSIRVATYPDTMLCIEVSEVPAQVRVSAMTPSGARLAAADAEIGMTDELLKGAPPDQQAVLTAQRARQQSAREELRKAAALERIRPTAEPVIACLTDPATGREYVRVSITVRDGAGAADAARGAPARTGPGAPANARGAR